MKTLLFTFLLLSFTSTMTAAQNLAMEYKQKWENAKSYTLSIAEAMPDSLYGTKPTEGEMTFAEQIKHLNQNMLWLHADFITPKDAIMLNKLKEKVKTAQSKKEIILVLSSSFDAIINLYNTMENRILKEEITLFGNTKSRNQVCLLAIDHLSHHRGQCAVYLRLINITPPKYIGY